MKKLFLFFCVMLVSASMSLAKVITVNNAEGASADYSLLQQAIDNANAGDTLYISGSADRYDGDNTIRINKQLVVLGPGYFLGDNEQTQASNLTASIYRLIIGEGGDGTIIEGLIIYDYIDIDNDKPDGTDGIPASNITIRKNMMNELIISTGSSGILVQGNYFGFLRNNSAPLFLGSSIEDITITNNIFGEYKGIQGTTNISYNSLIISNNTFSSTSYVIHNVDGAIIESNILAGGYIHYCDNNIIRNNVFTRLLSEGINYGSTGNTVSNNVQSANIATLFVVADPDADNREIDHEFRLGPNSQAKGAGVNGIDAGAFGGVTPYQLSGLPAIPAVYEILTTGIGNSSTGMKVTIKAKSNQ